jgi:hypothetical protein
MRLEGWVELVREQRLLEGMNFFDLAKRPVESEGLRVSHGEQLTGEGGREKQKQQGKNTEAVFAIS